MPQSKPLVGRRGWRHLCAVGYFAGMPTVLRLGPFRFFFYAGDRDEPRHVHVERDDNVAKFWLDPVRLQHSGGFGRVELQRVQRLVEQHREHLLRSWDEYFSDQSD